jgi:hypothetical protein
MGGAFARQRPGGRSHGVRRTLHRAAEQRHAPVYKNRPETAIAMRLICNLSHRYFDHGGFFVRLVIITSGHPDRRGRPPAIPGTPHTRPAAARVTRPRAIRQDCPVPPGVAAGCRVPTAPALRDASPTWSPDAPATDAPGGPIATHVLAASSGDLSPRRSRLRARSRVASPVAFLATARKRPRDTSRCGRCAATARSFRTGARPGAGRTSR